MRKAIALLMVLVLIMSMGITAAWADENTGADNQTGDEVVVESMPETLPPADTVTDEAYLEEELGLSAEELGTEPLPEEQPPDEQERARLHESLKAFVYGELDDLGWNMPSLLATSRKLAVVARNRAAYFNSHPRVKADYIRLCDQVVRLNAHVVKNEEVKQRVYRNMAAAYVFLGCYHRAIACLERGLVVGAKNGDLKRDLKYLYKKIGGRNLKIFVNGIHPKFDVQPQIINGRTMVPLRALAEALGSDVVYNNGQINFNRGGKQINIYVNNTTATVGGKKVRMDQPARVVNGRTLVPLRFMSENMNADVDYDGQSGMITVEDNAATAGN
ncbi:MAG: copper amine oxidase N-terminal domain-containing protein [Bacillota bacterium]